MRVCQQQPTAKRTEQIKSENACRNTGMHLGAGRVGMGLGGCLRSTLA